MCETSPRQQTQGVGQRITMLYCGQQMWEMKSEDRTKEGGRGAKYI